MSVLFETAKYSVLSIEQIKDSNYPQNPLNYGIHNKETEVTETYSTFLSEAIHTAKVLTDKLTTIQREDAFEIKSIQ